MTTTEPTFARVPDGDETTGQECVALARHYGIPLDEWQADVVRGILRESGGAWSASQVGIVLSRQSGKGQILTALALFGLFALGENILATSHATKTSSDAFRRLWYVIEAHGDLRAQVRRHSMATGAEFVELDTGARIAFTTRSASAGRGLSVDRLLLDEAEDMPAGEIGALLPTVFARAKSQVIFAGTAPGPAHDAESFIAMRTTAHDGTNPRMAWFEWSADWSDDIDDRDVWLRVNPAVAVGRVDIQAIEDDRAVLPADVFRAERLSIFVPRGAQVETLFDPEAWADLVDPYSEPMSSIAVAVDCPPSRDSATVCVAGRRDDGLAHVEWYETREGVTWLPAWIAPRLSPKVRALVIDSRSPLVELDWTSHKLRPTPLDSRAIAAAAGGFLDAVVDRGLRHRGQVELTRGVLGARQRPIGQAFGWDRKAPGSSTLVAASLALYGVDMNRPKRPIRSPDEGMAIVL